jgi:disulfide bond formation protein DsbB
MMLIDSDRKGRSTLKRWIAVIAVLALALASCGGGGDGGDDTTDSGSISAGEDIFSSTCSTCHGPDGTGIEGLGKDLHNNAFVAGLSDDEMLDFLNTGRAADHPDNDTGVAMPPKGGNPSLSDDDLLDVVAYVRTLD